MKLFPSLLSVGNRKTTEAPGKKRSGSALTYAFSYLRPHSISPHHKRLEA
ncbi:rCG63421 [Rattus norvegicus]|uniref:RCG63421 n=1 Tax=Rattus norvegicus TaxID=10116 RepID=A6IN48_RAT|nr:rCG63421 [Rattus norvegicus]